MSKNKNAKQEKKEIKIEFPVAKLGVKEIVYTEFLKAQLNGNKLPEANEIREILIANGIDKDSMAIQKIKNHYSFYKSKWQDILDWGKMIYVKK